MNTEVRLAGQVVTMNQDRFVKLWLRCDLDRNEGAARLVFRALRAQYSESWRRYHTGRHIEHCIKNFDLSRHLMQDPDAVEMALWFHDAIYDAQARNNERRSAELFMELCEPHFDPGFCRRVHQLIMVTEHCDPPDEGDACYMVDIDLSSFGLPWEEFDRDSRNVRAEFPHLNEHEYNSRQFNFLQRLVSRPSFYNSEFFRERCENNARSNLSRRLREMQLLGYSEAED